MLRLKDEAFCAGRATFRDSPESGNSPARVFVKIQIQAGGMPTVVYALLDTGAQYSVLGRELAEAAGVQFGSGQRLVLETAFGSVPGELVRHELLLCADEGDSLIIEQTLFVPDGPIPRTYPFLGYTSCLDSIRFGLDPQRNDFYFGPSG